ncbi:MAG: FadR/GntR family transcriptional regulator [candidate division WOR-3 bacterium]
MNTELQRPSLINEIVTEIRRRILSGQYAYDDYLPSQDVLAASLGVSRPSLREALNQLSLLGLVEAQHGIGTIVKRPNPYDFLFNFSSLVILDSHSADELLQARSIIEPAVVALAAENRTPEELAEIREILEAMEEEHNQTGVILKYKEKDLKFHYSIANASHNQILASICRAIRELLPTSIEKAFAASPELIFNAMKLHRKIFDALERKDPLAASESMRKHLHSVKGLHKKILEK